MRAELDAPQPSLTLRYTRQFNLQDLTTDRHTDSQANRQRDRAYVDGLCPQFFDYVGIEDPRITEFCAATCEPSPHAILRTCLLRNFGAQDRHIHTEMKKLEYQKIELTMRVGRHSATVVCKNKKAAKQRASQAILQVTKLATPSSEPARHPTVAMGSPYSAETRRLLGPKCSGMETAERQAQRWTSTNEMDGRPERPMSDSGHDKADMMVMRNPQALTVFDPQALHPHVRSWGSLLRLYGSRSVKSCKEKKIEEQQITLLQDKARHNEPNYAVLEKLRNEMHKLKERDEGRRADWDAAGSRMICPRIRAQQKQDAKKTTE
ncbi:hypothetical protein MSG28_005998 [Choristoneura fumiferana]|uniref:Uncharacterized protein n=1 Tax=Choristoneura fumiferana TaxID=7141 RepID=A0ACC0L1L0_CHOFU|nr:hypothetical protein MSG28_005998 [Choristoneura fumiferana]